MKAALADPAAGAEVKARVVDFAAYIHHLVLLARYYANGQTEADADANIKYLWQTADRAMVNAFYMTDRFYTVSRPTLKTKWGRTGGGWTDVAPLSDAQVIALLDADANAFPLSANVFIPEPFNGAITPYLASAPAPVPSNFAPVSNAMNSGQGRTVHVYSRQTPSILVFDVRNNARLHFVVTDPVGAVIRDEWYAPTAAWQSIAFFAPTVGLYTVVLSQETPKGADSPSGGDDLLQVSAGRQNGALNPTPFALVGPITGNGAAMSNPVFSPTTAATYFYVPVGTKKFALSFGGQVACAVVDPSNQRTPCTGWTVLDGTGKDGKIWTITGPSTNVNWKGTISLVGVPNLFSLHPDQVLKRER